jgi:hypothetical protein
MTGGQSSGRFGWRRWTVAALAVAIGAPVALSAQRTRGVVQAPAAERNESSATSAQAAQPQDVPAAEVRPPRLPIAIRPGTLGSLINTLAGYPVRVPSARVVGVFDPRAFLIESDAPLRPVLGHRSRIVVLVETGELRVEPELLVASTVTVSGDARTLLGMQVSREVPWPAALTRSAVDRLEIRAAVLARAVTTPEGVDLLAVR